MNPLLGLYREVEFSPGRHKSNDARLLELVADRLREAGLAVELMHMEEAGRRLSNANLVFSMCQGRNALETLADCERDGVRIINSPNAAMKTYRNCLPGLMENAGIRFPETRIISTEDKEVVGFNEKNGGFWLKRGDVHASVPADVQRLESLDQLPAGLADFAGRGIKRAAVQTHQPGDEIKFYGVGEQFFHWFYSNEPRGYSFHRRALKDLALLSAHVAGLEIFGGDIIVSSSGDLTLIDLNDWPSFAPCLGPASEAIGNFILSE